MPKAEAVLWAQLRRSQLGCRFRRQHPIDPYILDFACLTHRLAVECDGDHHDRYGRDRERDLAIERAGFTIMRFWNSDVLFKTGDVLATIASHTESHFDRNAWAVGRRPDKSNRGM
jgi:very-short-patch-repair endonuclease